MKRKFAIYLLASTVLVPQLGIDHALKKGFFKVARRAS